MGQNSEGPSGAAHGAPQDHTASDPTSLGGRPGFFTRVFGARRADMPELMHEDANESFIDKTPHRLSGLLALRRLRLDDVAIPRAEIVAVPSDISEYELLDRFRKSGMTRLPVFDGTLDNPVGMIHLKDFALRFGFGGGEEAAFDLMAMVRPVIYAPPSMPIGVLLQKMQSQRKHMALVIDEYGGVDGLVTIEDLIEQVIGEIEDEHDQEEGKFWRQEKTGSYVALARTPLEDFEAEIGMSLIEDADEEEVDTLGGLVFLLTGHVPARGEVVTHPSGVEFEVVDADPRRIKRLRVRLPGYTAAAGE
jgi:magnesium and cobalt transporter